MTVLITDAGLIGSHVARALLDQGVGVLMYDPSPSRPYVESVIGTDRKLFKVETGDVRDLPRIIDLMLRVGVTRILHPIGATSPRADEQPSLAFQVRVQGTLNLVEAARIRSLSRIVLVTSTDGPDSSFDGALDHAAQTVAQAYHQWAGVNVLICRLPDVYGRQPPGRPLTDPVYESIERVLAASREAFASIRLPRRERVYVKDAALALREAVFVERPTVRTYDLGSGEIVGPSELSAAVRAAYPSAQLELEADDAEAPALVDNAAAQADLGVAPAWTLTAAVADILSEMRSAG
jgi:nucleoside-diphosphate-sugar epimerase